MSKPVMYPCSKCYGMYVGLQGHLAGRLTGVFLNGGLPDTSRWWFRGVILREGFQVLSARAQKEVPEGGTSRYLHRAYLKVTLRAVSRGVP